MRFLSYPIFWSELMVLSSIQLLTCDCPHSRRSPSRCNRLRLKLSSVRKGCHGLLYQLISEHMLNCVPMRSAGIVHESADDSYIMRNIRLCRDHRVHQGAYCKCIQYRLHIFPLRTGCQAVSLRKPKMNGERGRNRVGQLHVEAF